MDHVKKLVYTIVGCLTIVSLTFTICTKIGHCAEDPFPFYFGGGQHVPFYCTYSFGKAIYNDAVSRHGGDPYVVYNPTLGNVTVIFCEVLSYYESNGYYGILYSNIYRFMRYSLNNDGSFTMREDVGGQNISYWGTTTIGNLSDSAVYENYPFYCSRSSYYYNNQLFLQLKLDSFNPHTKGGVLSNYDDSIGDIDNDPNLPKVDITPPADPSNNSSWYGKILNGIGKINQSIQGGVLTIGDYIGQFKSLVDNAIAWITETPDADTILDNVEPYLAQNDLISGFISSKTALQGVYGSIGNVSSKTRSQMVWDIPFNLPSMSQTFHAQIDFGWYENIRSTLEPFLNMFLCVGFLFSFIRSIPGILHGNSGEGDT